MKKLNWNHIRRKAVERRGASILMALFLLLVCLAVGAVILTASVAAGGRRSEIAKMDQRYYSVGSAAEVFRRMIEEQSVTVVREKVTTKETEYKITVDEDGKTHRGGSRTIMNKTDYDVHLDGSARALASDADSSILIRAAVDLMEGYADPEAIYGVELPYIAAKKKHTYTLSHTNVPTEVGDASVLDVEVIMSTDLGGNLTVALTAKDDDTDDSYSLTQVYHLVLSHRDSTFTESDAPEIVGSGDTYYEYVTKVTTTTQKDTFTWKFDSMDIER